MNVSVKTYKRQLDRDLRHIKLILAQERRHRPAAEWHRLVEETRESILKYPQDFLCNEIPSPATFLEAIKKVFDCFIEDQRLLASQKPKRFERFLNPERPGRK